MDYLIVFFIVIIVIATGYILSKPFSKQMDQSEEINLLEHEHRYQNLLEEIREIEKDCDSGNMPKEDCRQMITEKKELAANLLRVIDPTMKIENIVTNEIKAAQPEDAQGLGQFQSQGAMFCPQCGDQVLPNDKFCMHCGHILQT